MQMVYNWCLNLLLITSRSSSYRSLHVSYSHLKKMFSIQLGQVASASSSITTTTTSATCQASLFGSGAARERIEPILPLLPGAAILRWLDLSVEQTQPLLPQIPWSLLPGAWYLTPRLRPSPRLPFVLSNVDPLQRAAHRRF